MKMAPLFWKWPSVGQIWFQIEKLIFLENGDGGAWGVQVSFSSAALDVIQTPLALRVQDARDMVAAMPGGDARHTGTAIFQSHATRVARARARGPPMHH